MSMGQKGSTGSFKVDRTRMKVVKLCNRRLSPYLNQSVCGSELRHLTAPPPDIGMLTVGSGVLARYRGRIKPLTGLNSKPLPPNLHPFCSLGTPV
jgi:hypothetical protein